MSRIGKLPVMIPAGVEVKIAADNTVSVKGPKGELQEQISKLLKVEVQEDKLSVSRESDSKDARSAHGLYRTLVNNMVVGVTTGFEKKLTIIGVGYKADKKGDTLVLNLGYSHPIEMVDPEGIATETPSQTEIVIRGISKADVGNYAAIIRAKRSPEPYKGKGIRYFDEVVIKKEGKSGAK